MASATISAPFFAGTPMEAAKGPARSVTTPTRYFSPCDATGPGHPTTRYVAVPITNARSANVLVALRIVRPPLSPTLPLSRSERRARATDHTVWHANDYVGGHILSRVNPSPTTCGGRRENARPTRDGDGQVDSDHATDGPRVSPPDAAPLRERARPRKRQKLGAAQAGPPTRRHCRPTGPPSATGRQQVKKEVTRRPRPLSCYGLIRHPGAERP